jgi:hypothetical protein
MKKSFDEIFVRLDQVGVITPIDEVEELRKNMIDVFQLDEEKVTGGNVTRHANTIFRGVKQDPLPGVRMDFFDKDSFPVQLEYLSPVDGESAWMEYHKKVNKGIHHIRFDVSSHEDAIQYMKEHGIEAYHLADSPRGPDIKFAYFDAYDKLGFYIETINFTEVENKKKEKEGK